MPCRTRRRGLDVEGLGIVYLEASATGLPVVAGDSGGAPDAVREGETGYVVDGRDVAAIADRVATLLADPELARRMGAAGRAWVERDWRWDTQAARMRALSAGRRAARSRARSGAGDLGRGGRGLRAAGHEVAVSAPEPLAPALPPGLRRGGRAGRGGRGRRAGRLQRLGPAAAGDRRRLGDLPAGVTCASVARLPMPSRGRRAGEAAWIRRQRVPRLVSCRRRLQATVPGWPSIWRLVGGGTVVNMDSVPPLTGLYVDGRRAGGGHRASALSATSPASGRVRRSADAVPASKTCWATGRRPGTPVTLLQFSSAFCAPCRATRRVARERVRAPCSPGVRHVEVDAESHLDAVRALDIWRTPTTLIVDAGGRVVQRATGVPAKAQVVAAVAPMLDPPPRGRRRAPRHHPLSLSRSTPASRPPRRGTVRCCSTPEARASPPAVTAVVFVRDPGHRLAGGWPSPRPWSSRSPRSTRAAARTR